jgi:hypothetical protein
MVEGECGINPTLKYGFREEMQIRIFELVRLN